MREQTETPACQHLRRTVLVITGTDTAIGPVTCADCGQTLGEPAEEPGALVKALRELLDVIAADDLIPESVSYMRQARAALKGAEDDFYIPERDGRRCVTHPKADHELVCLTCLESEGTAKSIRSQLSAVEKERDRTVTHYEARISEMMQRCPWCVERKTSPCPLHGGAEGGLIRSDELGFACYCPHCTQRTDDSGPRWIAESRLQSLTSQLEDLKERWAKESAVAEAHDGSEAGAYAECASELAALLTEGSPRP